MRSPRKLPQAQAQANLAEAGRNLGRRRRVVKAHVTSEPGVREMEPMQDADGTAEAGDRGGRAGQKIRFLAVFALYFGALWYLWETPAIYPLKVFVVMLHEISHGIASVATGGTVEKIVLDAEQGGACFCPGGNAFVTLSAGYLGSLLWGVLLLSAAQSRRLSSRLVVLLLGVAVVVVSILYVRSGFGFFFGLGFGGALIVSWRLLGPKVNGIVLTTLGLTSCLYAVLDIKSDVLDRPHLQSDAAMLAEMTPISTTTWGIAWISIAVAVSWLSFWKLYRAA